ncbi:PilZ domain-containing protein, partial [Glaesserella parasuis]|uniref:PilZ domain-containing protein n=1 Tax=Glaesserella parasuis TaxID=738 RepID=UPI003B7FEEF4
RFVVDKPIILVGHDNRNRFFAELATVENLSSKGATLLTHRSLALRDQVHLFSPSGHEEEYVIALVRNLRKSHEDGRHRLGVEFLQKPGKWLF